MPSPQVPHPARRPAGGSDSVARGRPGNEVVDLAGRRAQAAGRLSAFRWRTLQRLANSAAASTRATSSGALTRTPAPLLIAKAWPCLSSSPRAASMASATSVSRAAANSWRPPPGRWRPDYADHPTRGIRNHASHRGVSFPSALPDAGPWFPHRGEVRCALQGVPDPGLLL